jgi:ABC-type dipeptide/oligopeptide/nickel transport system ATPase component
MGLKDKLNVLKYRDPKKLKEKLESEARSMTTTQGLKLAVKLDEISRKRYGDLSLYCVREMHSQCAAYRHYAKDLLQKDITCSCDCHNHPQAEAPLVEPPIVELAMAAPQQTYSKFSPQINRITGIIGNLGSGKSLLATVAALYDLEVEGKTVFANYHINYKTKDGRSCQYIDIGKLAAWLTKEGRKFPPNSATLVIDESYLGLDARQSNSPFNRLMSYFIFQSRKLGFNLIYTAQLSSSVEKRLRNLTDTWILAENLFEPNEVSGDIEENFYYTIVTPNTVNYFSITHETAMRFFPLYHSSEIITAPVGSVKKSELKKMQEEKVDQILKKGKTSDVQDSVRSALEVADANQIGEQ